MSLFVIEGLDFTGKSTITREFVRKRPNYVVTQTPPLELRGVKDFIDNVTSEETRILYYLAGCFHVSQLSSDKTTISDRYYYSTFVYEAQRTGKPMQDLLAEYKPLISRLSHPKKTIFLTVSPEKMYERFNSRGMTGLSDSFALDSQRRDQLLKGYMIFSNLFDWSIIDTSDYTIDEVFDKVLGEIDE